MKHKSLVIIALPALLLAACGGSKKNAENKKIELKTSKDSASYAAGLNEAERMATMMQQSGVDSLIAQDLFLEGFTDYMHKNPKLNPEVAKKALMNYFTAIKDRELAKFKSENAPKMDAAKKWMEENGKRNGVVTTSSGLQYEVLKKGSGANVKIGDMVKVHYEGAYTDGNIFESSYEHNEPYEFQLAAVGGVIQGWVEALQLMNKGAKFKVYIPYDLGYGEMGSAPTIPPYSNLVFTMEVVDVKPGN
jgi:FKBP-type peptidyl-prolyl cis-trans isomerase FklB